MLSAAFIATHSNSIDERPFDRKVTSALTTTRLNAPQALESQIYFRSA